jgi:GDP-L-fucose synthase
MKKDSRILVLGSGGLVGGAIVKKLQSKGYSNLLLPKRKDLDLIMQKDVLNYFTATQPEYVFLAAAKVGGIMANSTQPAEFIYQNLMVQSNVIHVSAVSNVEKLLFLGSSCIYPKQCPQPIKEDYLLSGHLESTNKAYAVAKIAGLAMCQAYRQQYGFNAISAMPCNLYGPGDNFDLVGSHVLPALLRKFHEAKPDGNVVVWGTGSPYREFLYIDDLADALYFLMLNYDEPELINVGSGKDLTIKELALLIQEITGHTGEVIWDTSKPNGTPRKILDISKVKSLGWTPHIQLWDGIRETYTWYLSRQLQ